MSTDYWLMDGRAPYDIESAIVLETCGSYEEAVANICNYGSDTCIVKVFLGGHEELIWNLLWGRPPSEEPITYGWDDKHNKFKTSSGGQDVPTNKI